MKTGKKEVTNDDIARAVLRSQPPNPTDVPDMVDYNAKWGGGSSHFYVNDVLRFLALSNVSPDIRVSGRTFRALADLKFGVADVPAIAVNAVLKRMASSDKTIDGVASVYKVSEISSLATKQKKAFLAANKIMENSKKMLDDNTMHSTARTLNEGWLQTSLIDHVLGKPNVDGKSFETMQEIVTMFLETTFGKSEKVAAAVAASSSASSRRGTFVIDYDKSDKVIAVPQMMLEAKGFKVGGTIYTNEAQ